jgi:sugar-specific transcriptional regulator TrmB
MKIGKPIKYIAVPPEEVIERVKKKINEDAHVHAKILDDLKESDVMNELNLLHSQGIEMIDPNDLSGLLKGRKNLYGHYESMINSSNESIMMMTTDQGIIRKVHHLSNPLQKAHNRGVNITISGNFSDETMSTMKNMLPFATIIKTDEISGRFLITDNQNVIVALLDGEETHPTYDGGIWINTPFFAQTLSKMFNCVHKRP